MSAAHSCRGSWDWQASDTNWSTNNDWCQLTTGYPSIASKEGWRWSGLQKEFKSEFPGFQLSSQTVQQNGQQSCGQRNHRGPRNLSSSTSWVPLPRRPGKLCQVGAAHSLALRGLQTQRKSIWIWCLKTKTWFCFSKITQYSLEPEEEQIHIKGLSGQQHSPSSLE